MDINVIAVIASSLGAGTIVGGLVLGVIKSNFGNVISIAVLTKRIDIQDKEIADVKLEMEKIVTNYNAKFKDQRDHVTSEVDRAVTKIDALGEAISKVNNRCFAFHPELVE